MPPKAAPKYRTTTRWGLPMALKEGPMVDGPGVKVQTLMSDGWTLHSERFEAANGATPKAIIVNSHGWCESATESISVRKMAYAYTEAGYEMFAYDSHAHGLSLTKKDPKTGKEKTVPRGFAEQDMNIRNRKHVVQLIEQLVIPRCKEFGAALVLQGLSMGGTTSMMCHSDVRELCKKNNVKFAISVYKAPGVRPTEANWHVCCCRPCYCMCWNCCTCCKIDIATETGQLHTDEGPEFLAPMYCPHLCTMAYDYPENGAMPTSAYLKKEVQFQEGERYLLLGGEKDEEVYPYMVRRAHKAIDPEQKFGEFMLIKNLGHEMDSEKMWKRLLYEIILPTIRQAVEGGEKSDYYKEASFYEAEHTNFEFLEAPGQEAMKGSAKVTPV